MTTEPTLDDTDPFWQVHSVLDESGSGRDFAYTIGLDRAGLPELHLWARPSLGDDPGHDWKLSSRDQCHVLNELAGLLLERSIGVGSVLTREYDGGLATVTYRLDPPQDHRSLAACDLPPGIEVLPVRWSLARTPEGDQRALTPEARRIACATYDQISGSLDLVATAPSGWRLPARPTFAVEQPFGPLTPMVLARAAQLWQADDETMCDLLHVAVKVTRAFSLSWALSRAIALARPVGRRGALERVQADGCALVERLTVRPAARLRWQSIVRRSDPVLWEASTRSERRQIEQNLAGPLQLLTLACLSVEAVADVADGDLLLCGRGPWLSGLQWQRVPPGPEWAAAPAVQDVVRQILAGMGPQTMLWVADTHHRLRDNETHQADRYRDVCHHLEAWATVSAAGFPSYPLHCHLAVWKPMLDRPLRVSATAMASLHEWATLLACALTYRLRLCQDDVAAFVTPYRCRVPGLERALNDLV